MKILDFYKLKELPFSNAPDTRYLYASSTHREALASLLHGVKSGCGSPRADTISICTEGFGSRTPELCSRFSAPIRQLRIPTLSRIGRRFACQPGPDSVNATQSSGNRLINLRS
jgi:hypothetical protein